MHFTLVLQGTHSLGCLYNCFQRFDNYLFLHHQEKIMNISSALIICSLVIYCLRKSKLKINALFMAASSSSPGSPPSSIVALVLSQSIYWKMQHNKSIIRRFRAKSRVGHQLVFYIRQISLRFSLSLNFFFSVS